jgi:hypothetical protein
MNCLQCGAGIFADEHAGSCPHGWMCECCDNAAGRAPCARCEAEGVPMALRARSERRALQSAPARGLTCAVDARPLPWRLRIALRLLPLLRAVALRLLPLALKTFFRGLI